MMKIMFKLVVKLLSVEDCRMAWTPVERNWVWTTLQFDPCRAVDVRAPGGLSI